MKTKLLLSYAITSLLIASCSSNEEIVIGLYQPIHHDDFEYVVTDYKIEKKIGDEDVTLLAKGKFYIVSFKTVNNAMRVKHEWNNAIGYLVDKAGNSYENNIEAQQLLERVDPFGWQEKYVTAHQTTQSTRFVFDLPESVAKPYLKVRGSTLMGDFFDGNKFEKTKVKLF